MSQGSDSLLATAFPIMSSEKIWPTRAVRQPFSRSSVGRRMAKTADTSSWRYAASFSAWAAMLSGLSGRGTGVRAGRGHSEW